MKIKLRVLIGIFTYILCVIMFLIIPFSEILNKGLGILTIILSAVWIYKCWNNVYLLILSSFIAYSNYSIVMGIYLDSELRPKYLYPQITDINVYGIGVAMLFLLMLSLVFLTRKCPQNNINVSEQFVRKENKNNLLFTLAAVGLLFIMIIGYSRETHGRGTSSALYEYGSILLAIMFFYSGDLKKKKLFCGIFCAIYVFTSLLNGTRIEALICLLIFVLCYFKKTLKPKHIFGGMICGLVIFSIIGAIRGNWTVIQTQGLTSLLTRIFREKLVFDTCTHAYFPMLCMIEQFKMFSIENVKNYFFPFVMTIFIGQGRVLNGDLINVVAEKYYHNYGGVTIGFFYVWFSYLGSMLFAMIIVGYISFIAGLKNIISDYKSCAVLYVVASVPRWYLYGPWSLLRGVMLCIIVFWFFRVLDLLMRAVRKQ